MRGRGEEREGEGVRRGEGEGGLTAALDHFFLDQVQTVVVDGPAQGMNH